ncbi:MAG: hypothetical protein ABEL04_01515 [Salinibacter sp.]|uniref:hypothetical protein n=1 Tax=Salinibacter sp. TaxID=2065818 RepID=UPI0035D3DBFF
MDRPPQYAELAAHAALIAVAVLASWAYWRSGEPEASSAAAPTVYVDSSEALSTWRPSERRIFLFVSPTCQFCTRSMDFYARLGRVVDSMQRAGAPVALAAVIDAADSPRAQRQILRDSNVAVDTLLSLSSSSLMPVGVTGVPTVAVEAPETSSRSAWEGLQDLTGEQEILSVVRSLEEAP